MPLKVLIIDGSDATQRMVAHLLKRRIDDIEVVCCGTAASALEELRAGPADLISTALVLPDLDGLELARRVRTLANHHWTPIIVASGDADARSHNEGFSAGVTAFIDKAEGLNPLVDFVQTYLARAHRPAGRVLYVEDSATAAMAVRQMLELDNLDVVHLMSAEEARDVLEATGIDGPDGFDILVSDILLKGRMSGTDLVRYIRHGLRYTQERFPALLITVEGISQQERERLLQSGADGLATKPLNRKDFVAQINTLIMNRRHYEAHALSQGRSGPRPAERA
jgi:two-component system cell cycle response regulator